MTRAVRDVVLVAILTLLLTFALIHGQALRCDRLEQQGVASQCEERR